MPAIKMFSCLAVLFTTAMGVSACTPYAESDRLSPKNARDDYSSLQFHKALHRGPATIQPPTEAVARNYAELAPAARNPHELAASDHSKAVYTRPANPDAYGLNIGDTVKITTFGHADLSGEFMVEANGSVNLPLVGNIAAIGKTPQQLENDIRYKLASGYLIDPKVSVEVANLRQFYIVGEVGKPGAYDYVPSLNVLKAVAIAGGFTRRAVTDEFVILRTDAGNEQKMKAKEETTVLPGDTIRVDERFF